jgi:acyl dehydratase
MCATGKVTFKQYVEDLKKGIGKVYYNEWNAQMGGPKFPRPIVDFNTEVTRDSIKHFVDAMGNLNPLYRDREYAKKTKYGCLIAPPVILYTIALAHYPDPPDYPPPPEFPTLYAGDEYEWFSPISEGDEIDWKTTYPTDVKTKQTKTAGTATFLYGKHEFSRHQGGVPLATCNFWVVLYNTEEFTYWPAERQEIEQKQDKFPAHTEEYIKEVYAAQDRELVRGAEPRYWEDVEVGEELTPVVRGPFTVDESIAWIIAAGEYYFCSDRLFRYIHEHTGWGAYHPDLKVHLNFKHGTYDFSPKGVGGWGAQRTSWLDMVLTNWMGDEGFLWKLRSEHRRRGGYGNVFWCKAKVAKKYADKGRYCVDIDCWVEDQTGDVILRGSATVLLPSREHGPVIYPSPRPAV